MLLFLHGRHAPCKSPSGLDTGGGTGQTFATGECANKVAVSPTGPSGPELPGDIGSETGFWPSWQGYNYLSDLLASWGYVVISPSAGALVAYDGTGPIDAGALARAEIIANTLDLLYAWNEGEPAPSPTATQLAAGEAGIGTQLAGKLDFSKIGVMGHSRGGEAVTEFIPYNRARPEPGRRYPLQAVFSLAPIDRNKHMPFGTNYATLLPACDGDVTTLAGANAFERGKYAKPEDPFAKVQYYVEGANHNFYNSRWPSSDRTGSDVACGSTPPTRIRLSPADQRRNGLATMATFLRAYLGGEEELMPWISGEAGYPASGCPLDATHVPFCEDLVKQTYIAPAGERRDVVRPGPGVRPTTAAPQAPNEAGGIYRGDGFSIFQWCNPDPFVTTLANPPASQTTAAIVPCEGPVSGTTSANSAIQSWGPQLTLAWNGPATLTATLRGEARDESGFDNLVFRAAVQANDKVLNPLGNGWDPRTSVQDFHVALIDRDGTEGVRRLTELKPGGLQKALGATPNNTQHVILGQFRAPLSLFASEGVDLSDLDRIEFRFGGAGVNPTGAIQFADVAFQDDPELPSEAPLALSPLPGDPPVPQVDAVLTGAPHLATADGVCVDRSRPTVRISTVLAAARVGVAGSAADNGCAGGRTAAPSPGSIERVQVAIVKKAGKRCRFLGAGGRLTKPLTCAIPTSLVANGRRRWKLRTPRALPPGRYLVVAQAIDGVGNVSAAKVRRIEVAK